MNRATVTTGDDVDARSLPGIDGDGRLRVLTITADELGWRTYASSLSSMTAAHDDVDAVHLLVTVPGWVRAAGAKLGEWRPPGRLDPHYRRTLASTAATRRWLRRNVDLRRFDVVHATPQLAALPLLGLPERPPFSVGLDATLLQGKMQRRAIDEEDDAARRFAPLRDLERRVLDAAAAVVCMSGWACDAVRTETGRTEGLTVVPPSVDGIAPGRRRPAGHDGPVRMVFVGNDWRRKGGDELLALHQRHLCDRVELHVCSAGAPIDETQPGVVWHGATPREVVLGEILPAMDLFVLPTRSDMSPWAVVEAVASGLPVVSSAIGGITELVVDGETGYLVEPGDADALRLAVEKLVDDPDLRAGMTAATEARAAQELDHRLLGDRMVAIWRAIA